MKINLYKVEESSVFDCSFRYAVIKGSNGIFDFPIHSDSFPMDIRKLKRLIRKGVVI